MRKFLGVPTQAEITQQFNAVKEMIKSIRTFEQIKEVQNKFREVEINYNPINEYKNEDIEVIRYEYENILVYAYIVNDDVIVSDFITLYADDGLQFGDERYYNYEQEIERVNKMGLLQEIEGC